MLQPLFEELRLFLAPRQASGVLVKRGLGTRVVANFVENTPEELLAGLAQEHQVRGRGAQVCLSHHYVQTLLLPWQTDLANEEEWQAYARHVFDETFGPRERILRLVRQRPGQPVVAMAIDAGAWQGLAQGILSAGLKLRSAVPYSAAVLNHYRERMRDSGWLFAAEPGLATALRFEQGTVVSCMPQPLEGEVGEGLATAVSRELAKYPEVASPAVWVHASRLWSRHGLDREVHLLAAGQDSALGVAS